MTNPRTLTVVILALALAAVVGFGFLALSGIAPGAINAVIGIGALAVVLAVLALAGFVLDARDRSGR